MSERIPYTAEELVKFRANVDPSMRLPEGKSCADCYHCRRCTGMFGAFPENTWCDFAPSRFSPKS